MSDNSDIAKLKTAVNELTRRLEQYEADVIMNAQPRLRFIRQAAIAIHATHMKLISTEEAWTWAKTLWENKPEDC